MAELGTYYITIMPEMSQFTGEVKKALSTAGNQGGKSFSTSFANIVKGSAIGTALGGLASKAGNAIMSGLDTGIRRLDTLKNYPRVLESLGYSSDAAAKSIKTITDHLDGLPSSTQDLVALTQSIADSTGDLDLATTAALGFNDMLLAAGASSQDAATAQAVLNRVLGKGSATAQQWSSLTAVMPAQLGMVADKMLGTGSTAEDLHTALENGTVSWNDFLQAIADLDQSGYIDENGKSIASFTEQAKANSVGIGTAIENVKNRIGAGWASILDVAGQENVSGAIDTMSYGIRDGMNRVAEGLQYVKDKVGGTKIGENLKKICDAISDGLKKLGEAGTDKLRTITDTMVDFIDKALQWVVDNGDACATTLAAIGAALAFHEALGAIGIIGGIVSGLGALAEVLPMVTTVAELGTAFTLAAEAGGPLAGIFGALAGVIASPFVVVVGAIAAAAGGLAYFFTQTEKGRELWAKFTNGLKEFGGKVAKDIKGGLDTIKQNLEDNKVQWQKFKTNLAKWNEEIRQKVTQKWQAIKDGISKHTQAAKDSLVKNWNESRQKVVDLNEKLRTGILNKWNAIKTTVTNVVNGIKTTITNVWNAIVTVVTNTVNKVKTSVTNGWNGIKTTITNVVNAIKTTITNVFNGIKTSVANITSSISSAASNAWNNIKNSITNKMNDAKNAVSNKLSEMRSAISGFAPKFKAIAAPVIGSISGKLSEMRSAITGFAPKFKSIAAPVIGGISDALGSLRDKIVNFRPSFPKLSWPLPSMPHIPTPHFSVSSTSILGGIVKIPKVSFLGWYAKGGIFDSASLIGVGERGREAALPLNRKSYGEIARGIAREGSTAPVINISGNTFYVRNDRDIELISDSLARKVYRERWAS